MWQEPNQIVAELPDPQVVDLPLDFDTYYRRDYRSLVGLAYILTGSQFAAEDLVQEALTSAHRNWDKISGYDKPEAWVRRVMVNRSTSRFRKLKTETKLITRLRILQTESIEATEYSGEVWEAVRALPTKQGQAVALFYWDDLPIADIATIMECGSETVKTHLKRARQKLSSSLAGFDLARPDASEIETQGGVE